MSGKTQIDIVHVLGWMGNLSRTLVIRREIGRFKNRETKPSWGLLIRSVFSSSFDMFCSAVLQCRCPNVHNRWRQRGAGKSSIGSKYYYKCHGKLPLPGIFRFPVNCHAPSVLLLLLVAEGINVFAKGSVNFTIGKLIDELEAFERFKARGRTAEYLRLDSRARAYAWHRGRSLQTHRLVGSRHGWCLRGTHGLGTMGPPNSECTRLDSTHLSFVWAMASRRVRK